MTNDKTNTGGLWKNDRKTKDTHPQATGSAQIVCPKCQWAHDYFIDAWTNDRDGSKWQKLKFKAKDKQSLTGSMEKAQPAGGKAEDDEIPF